MKVLTEYWEKCLLGIPPAVYLLKALIEVSLRLNDSILFVRKFLMDDSLIKVMTFFLYYLYDIFNYILLTYQKTILSHTTYFSKDKGSRHQ